LSTVVADRASLLNELRIDRSSEDVTGARRWPWIAAACTVAALGASAWLFAASREPAAAASPVPSPAAAAPAPAVATDSILDASGYVVARRQATVSSKITGKVVAVLIEEGQVVAAGDVIARLDDTNARAERERARAELEQQRAELQAVETALANAVPTFERQRRQYAAAVISAQTFDDAKASYDSALTRRAVAQRGVEVGAAHLELRERNLDDTIVRAPFGGVVTVKAAQEGEMVSPVSAGGGFTRTGLGTIVDMESLEVEVDVSENFISRVRPGQRTAITLNAYPDRRLPGRVIAIVPTADRAKATVKVRVGFEQRDVGVLPEMGARVAFLSSDAPE
jgi:RND family efflux transporter MFP subunit